MNRNIILALFFLISFQESFCSQNDSDEIVSQPDTEVATQTGTEILSFRPMVDWTDLNEWLEKQGSIFDSSESYTQREGCGTDQIFITFLSGEFKDIPTEVLIALLNKSEKIKIRK